MRSSPCQLVAFCLRIHGDVVRKDVIAAIATIMNKRNSVFRLVPNWLQVRNQLPAPTIVPGGDLAKMMRAVYWLAIPLPFRGVFLIDHKFDLCTPNMLCEPTGSIVHGTSNWICTRTQSATAIPL